MEPGRTSRSSLAGRDWKLPIIRTFLKMKP
jgi:hypothetical protein